MNGTVNEFFAKGQEVYVVITPNDGVENGTPVQSNAVVVSNSAPVMNSVTVTPDPATVGADDLTCDVTATDADGDSILYTYEWSDSTGIQQTMTDVSDTSDIFLSAGLTADTWSCDVTPFDGTDYGNVLSDSTTVESGCSSIQFIDNSGSITVANDGFGVGSGDWTFEHWVRIDDNFTGGTICLFKMKITPPMPSELRITSQLVSHDATPIEIPVVLTIWIMGIPIRLTTVNGTHCLQL